MSLLKYIERLQFMHHLIEKEGTGTSEEFAERVGISRSLLMEHLKEMREAFGAPIDYNRKRQTFYYNKSFTLEIKILSEINQIKGGQNIVFDCSSVQLYWTLHNYIYDRR